MDQATKPPCLAIRRGSDPPIGVPSELFSFSLAFILWIRTPHSWLKQTTNPTKTTQAFGQTPGWTAKKIVSFVSFFLCLFVCMFVCLPVSLSVCLLVSKLVCLLVCFFACLFVCLLFFGDWTALF
jgi:hypothetical protein